jgi:hypothetical protein
MKATQEEWRPLMRADGSGRQGRYQLHGGLTAVKAWVDDTWPLPASLSRFPRVENHHTISRLAAGVRSRRCWRRLFPMGFDSGGIGPSRGEGILDDSVSVGRSAANGVEWPVRIYFWSCVMYTELRNVRVASPSAEPGGVVKALGLYFVFACLKC